ncbi:MAG: nucleoside diphosphate kinase regulator [Xanthobacteraceae bacterium]|nr:nucleoside diphosphate kinase regulator [Xanthobacteraceae bacterium]MBX3522522.1 nucleoside diphosphate kinase regulator [Xanthobacteraceae bacterium]MBX3535569.1 nucleoside diphosphate kinase regulator [Xanthobacteraceae bacterium]MBX3550533.1 nucleoside diphosphate kinase regulator [Xanthobacteraceae bacterium]MCW5673690.1 nucleoside diphosphate kinase regulator [Xanthobacteraceae bacterium]
MARYFNVDLPPIAITRRDSERLSRLAAAATDSFPQTSEFLAREVERAHLIEDFECLPGLVGMNSEIEYRDDISGQVRRVKLVYPEESAPDSATVSVLTPVGAALIGLSVSQSIEFQTPSGGWRSLTVLKVRNG